MNSNATVSIDGDLVPANEVCLSPFDLGVTVGLGAFETMLSYDGSVFAWDLHFDRLQNSLQGLGLPTRTQHCSFGAIAQAMQRVIEANDLQSKRARIRVAVTAGEVSLSGLDTTSAGIGRTIVSAASQPQPSATVELITVPHRLDKQSCIRGLKSASYAPQVLAFRHACSHGAGEGVMLNSDGQVAEGTMSNIFAVMNGVVKTPSLESTCLAGVTRAIVIDLCQQHGIALEECDLYPKDLAVADELFVTSSAREVQGVSIMDGKAVVGNSLTQLIAQIYRQHVDAELEKGKFTPSI